MAACLRICPVSRHTSCLPLFSALVAAVPPPHAALVPLVAPGEEIVRLRSAPSLSPSCLSSAWSPRDLFPRNGADGTRQISHQTPVIESRRTRQHIITIMTTAHMQTVSLLQRSGLVHLFDRRLNKEEEFTTELVEQIHGKSLPCFKSCAPLWKNKNVNLCTSLEDWGQVSACQAMLLAVTMEEV